MTMSSSKKRFALDALMSNARAAAAANKKSKPSLSPNKRKTITLNSKNPIYKKPKLNPEWHESLVPKLSISEKKNQNCYTTPTPTKAPHYSTTTSRCDSALSDTSFASSRPSSARQNKKNQRRTINNYLSLNQFHIKLKRLPSDKDINETLKFILSRLDYLLSNTLEEDLSLVLKLFKSPVMFNKSWLNNPGTPFCFPNVLNVMHWLVQLAFYNEHVVNSTNVISDDIMFDYCLTSYLHYIARDDDAVYKEDAAFTHKINLEVDTEKQKINAKKENLKDLEAKLKAMRSQQSLRELRELKEKMRLQEEDVNKFNHLIEQLRDDEARVEKQMEEKEKQLRFKMEERSKISAENEELKRKVEGQCFNMSDAKRMKMDLQAFKRDIREAKTARTELEKKSSGLQDSIRTKLNELKKLQFKCNQAIRSLKLGNGFEYELNDKGATPIEVLGDYKSKLKPGLKIEELKTRQKKMENLESKVRLQQVSNDIAAMIKAKESRIAILQSHIDELNSQIDVLQKETQDHISSCEKKARQLQEKFEADSRNVDLEEKQAHEYLKNAKAALQETSARCKEEEQMRANELLALIDSVSKYKEFTTSKISQMKEIVSETAAAIAQVHNDSLASSIGTLPKSEV